MNNANPFTWRHFEAEIILLCVCWYVRYALSYRGLEEMMLERGLHVDHTTIYRWVQRYAPELEKRCRPHLTACNDSRTSGRDVYQDQKSLGLSLLSRKFRRQHTRVSLEFDARCRGGHTLWFFPFASCSHILLDVHEKLAEAFPPEERNGSLSPE